jgi:hypothetical protein
MTSVDRTAYPRFGRVVPGRELADAFTPADAEAEWARSRTQAPEHLLALAVLLKSYQRLGYFPKAEDVPAVVVRHVRGCLGIGPDVEFGQTAERTGKRHREFVRARMKVTYDPARVREVAERAIRKAAQAKDNPADLINVALEELVRARCELPGYTTLDAMAATVRAEVNTAFYQAVARRIGPVARLRLGRLYVVDPVTRRSEFDRLKDVAKSASLGKFRLRLDLLADIDALGPTEEWLDGVPPGKIAHFAGEARVTDVADLRKIQDESERLLGVLGDVLSAVREATAGGGQDPAAGQDAEEAAGRLVLKTLERAGGVEALSASATTGAGITMTCWRIADARPATVGTPMSFTSAARTLGFIGCPAWRPGNSQGEFRFVAVFMLSRPGTPKATAIRKVAAAN